MTAHLSRSDPEHFEDAPGWDVPRLGIAHSYGLNRSIALCCRQAHTEIIVAMREGFSSSRPGLAQLRSPRGPASALR